MASSSLYDRYLLPWLIDCACRHPDVDRQRRLLVPEASGEVLEIGMGSGLNLPYYDSEKVTGLWGLDPSAGMHARAAARINRSPVPVRWLTTAAEDIPLPDGSVDTVVMTYTLCSIADAATALAQIRRVLKPQGKLLFSEHGAAPEPAIRFWQNRLTPLWKRISGGCHLNRPVATMIEQAGFAIGHLHQGYLDPGSRLLKIVDFNYRGWATPRCQPPEPGSSI